MGEGWLAAGGMKVSLAADQSAPPFNDVAALKTRQRPLSITLVYRRNNDADMGYMAACAHIYASVHGLNY